MRELFNVVPLLKWFASGVPVCASSLVIQAFVILHKFTRVIVYVHIRACSSDVTDTPTGEMVRAPG